MYKYGHGRGSVCLDFDKCHTQLEAMLQIKNKSLPTVISNYLKIHISETRIFTEKTGKQAWIFDLTQI